MTDKITVDVQVMQTSAGADYYVRIKCGNRETTPYMFKSRFKAEYEAEHFRWLFGFSKDEPDVMEYNEKAYPNLYEPMTKEEVAAVNKTLIVNSGNSVLGGQNDRG